MKILKSEDELCLQMRFYQKIFRITVVWWHCLSSIDIVWFCCVFAHTLCTLCIMTMMISRICKLIIIVVRITPFLFSSFFFSVVNFFSQEKNLCEEMCQNNAIYAVWKKLKRWNINKMRVSEIESINLRFIWI